MSPRRRLASTWFASKGRPLKLGAPSFTITLKDLVSTDFFVVPTVNFRILFVSVVLAHHRRRVVHFNVTAHPTSEWTSQQMVKPFPWDAAPRYLLHDRDSIYGDPFRQRVRGMGP